MKIMTMIWPTSMARRRSARQLRRKKRITAIAMRKTPSHLDQVIFLSITAIAMGKRKSIIAIVMRTRKSITAIAMKAKSLIITMSITTTDAIWQRS